MIELIFEISKKWFLCLKIIIKFSKETKIDIMYSIITLYKIIFIHPPQDKKNIYNREESKD